MSAISFSVTSGSTIDEATGSTSSINIFAEDLGNCQSCIDRKGSCWACITTDQQIFEENTLTNIVSDGYYSMIDSDGIPAVWYIIGGFPQIGGFSNP